MGSKQIKLQRRAGGAASALVLVGVSLGGCGGTGSGTGMSDEVATPTASVAVDRALECDQWEGSDIVVSVEEGSAATGPGAAEDPLEAIRNFAVLEGLAPGEDSQLSESVWARVGADGRTSHILRLSRSGDWWFVSGMDQCAPAQETTPTT